LGIGLASECSFVLDLAEDLDGIVPKHVNPCPQDFIKRLSIISQTPEALARCGRLTGDTEKNEVSL
jgi:hypothetical protein